MKHHPQSNRFFAPTQIALNIKGEIWKKIEGVLLVRETYFYWVRARDAKKQLKSSARASTRDCRQRNRRFKSLNIQQGQSRECEISGDKAAGIITCHFLACRPRCVLKSPGVKTRETWRQMRPKRTRAYIHTRTWDDASVWNYRAAAGWVALGLCFCCCTATLWQNASRAFYSRRRRYSPRPHKLLRIFARDTFSTALQFDLRNPSEGINWRNICTIASVDAWKKTQRRSAAHFSLRLSLTINMQMAAGLFEWYIKCLLSTCSGDAREVNTFLWPAHSYIDRRVNLVSFSPQYTPLVKSG